AIPQDFPSALVETVDVPGVRRSVCVGINIAEEPMTKELPALAADGGGNEHFVAPDHGACVREPGNRSLPENVCAFGRIPGRGGRLTVGNSGSIGASKRGPVLSLRAEARDQNA